MVSYNIPNEIINLIPKEILDNINYVFDEYAFDGFNKIWCYLFGNNNLLRIYEKNTCFEEDMAINEKPLIEICQNEKYHIEVIHVNRLNGLPLKTLILLPDISSFGTISDIDTLKPHLGNYYYKITKNDKKYFVKIINDSRFSEIDVYNKFNHSNIMKPIYTWRCKKSNLELLILPYIEKDLYSIIMERMLTTEDIKSVLFQIYNGLQHMLDKNYLYIDLKPENIMIDLINNEYKAHIIDVGKIIDLNNYKENTPSSESCTEYYMPPENILFKYYSTKSLSWKFGMILYSILEISFGFRTKQLKKKMRDYEEKLKFQNNYTNDNCSYLNKYKSIRTFELYKKDKFLDDLLDNLLEIDYKKRIEFSEIKKHNWFNNLFPPQICE